MASPTASVIIPVFNGEATLDRAIESALDQDFADFEVIVVNDGSTDSTTRILGRYSGRVRVVTQDRKGPPVARITGSVVARGRYLAFLDADDMWLKPKLRKMVAVLDDEPESVLAYSNVIPVDHCGCRIGGLYVTGDVARPPAMTDLLRQLWPILPSAAVIRRSTFESCAASYRQFTKRGYEDCYLWLLAREQGPFQYVAEPLVIYRQPPLNERLYKYRAGFRMFVEFVSRRYGPAGRELVREANRAYGSTLGHLGLLAMAEGQRAQARGYFMVALCFRAFRVRNALRLSRSFLPRAVARMLTGRTRTAYRVREAAASGALPLGMVAPGANENRDYPGTGSEVAP
jgi:glycosyltransferase involved in cell wall biosynthesis